MSERLGMPRTFFLSSLLWAGAAVVWAEEPVQYSTEMRTEPRLLQIHQLVIDLKSTEIEVDALAGEDPDGDGPIEALLTPPMELVQQGKFIAAVNTNPWVMVEKPFPGIGSVYVAGGKADMTGWVRTRLGQRSAPTHGHWSLWIEKTGRGHVGNPQEKPDAIVAVSGFGGLLHNGAVLPEASTVLHPRTAAGVDREGRWLTLLVIDGRQQGFSEGVSERELAEIMLEKGCTDALNLDGGGSTVMIKGDDAQSLKIRNRPSDKVGPRPVPVILGVRIKSGGT